MDEKAALIVDEGICFSGGMDLQGVIRKIQAKDKLQVLDMMREFYASPAVFTSGSDEIFERDIEQCLRENPYIEGYVFHSGDDIKGYAMVAKSYSTEFGRPCMWIEDIYIKEQFRGKGIGRKFLSFIESKYPDAIFRLEVEAENEHAVKLYKSEGFDFLPYLEMKKQADK